MGEPVGAKRQVKPWVAVVVIAAAVVVLGGAWVAIIRPKISGRPRTRDRVAAPHGKEWNRVNNLCRRLNMAGNSYAVSGMCDSALACYREALRIAKKNAIIERMAASYQDISNVFSYKRMPESVRFYMDAATALNRTPDKKSQIGSGLLEEGTFQFSSLGNVDSGKVLIELALAEGRKRGNRWTEAGALNNLGLIMATLKDYDSARVLFESCAVVGRLIKDCATEAGAYHNLAMIYMRRDRLDDAKPWLLKAIEMAHAGALVGEEASALFDIALIRAEDGDDELAQRNVEQALRLFKSAGDNSGVNRCRYLLDGLIDTQRQKHRAETLDSLLEGRKREPNPGM
jgi:tetratricopeptide (TPR) repeat protein